MSTEKTTSAEKTVSKVEAVTMTDGRKVEFAGKRRLVKESFVSDTGEVSVRLDFRNGETRTFTVNTNMLNKFAAHGAEQKLGDEIAGIDDIEDAVASVDELIARLNKGEWSSKKEGGSGAGASILQKALVEYTGKTPEQIKDFLSGKSQAEKVALRANAKIKPIIERLEAEKAAKGEKGKAPVDTDAMLGELEG